MSDRNGDGCRLSSCQTTPECYLDESRGQILAHPASTPVPTCCYKCVSNIKYGQCSRRLFLDSTRKTHSPSNIQSKLTSNPNYSRSECYSPRISNTSHETTTDRLFLQTKDKVTVLIRFKNTFKSIPKDFEGLHWKLIDRYNCTIADIKTCMYHFK